MSVETVRHMGDRPLGDDQGRYEDPDSALVQLARAGDNAAFTALVRQYKDRIFHLILRITGNHEDAEDQVQETFLRAYRGLEAFRGHSRFSSWLITIARNQALQCLRRRHRNVSIDQPIDDEESIIHAYELQERRPDPEQQYCDTERAVRVHRSVVKLPHSLRSVLILMAYKELTSEETATILGITTAAVKSRVLRARRRLSRRY